MSKHESRKSRWAQVSSKEYRALFGVVRYQAGAWEGTVIYELWHEAGPDEPLPRWEPQRASAGRFKRPRNAMMEVEEKARALRRRYGDRVKVAIEE
jgi:hypothetical protein